MTDKVAYLSDAWLAAADLAVADLTPLDGHLVVAMVINGGPQDQYRYDITLGPDSVGFASTLAGTSAADVSMTMEWSVAVGVAQGQRGAQRAFLDGDIVLDGDVTRLLGHQEALAAIDDRLADLRARTDFSG